MDKITKKSHQEDEYEAILADLIPKVRAAIKKTDRNLSRRLADIDKTLEDIKELRNERNNQKLS